MIDQETLDEVFAIAKARREERRRFIKIAGSAVVAAGGLTALSACDDGGEDGAIPTPPQATPTPTSPFTAGDIDILNFALNLEYLEGSYYTAAALGSGLNPLITTGTGTQGAVTGGRRVAFADNLVASYAREIAADENAHINFLRTNLGSAAVAIPAINIDGGATGAFTVAARSAGIVGATGTFDPYANDDNFLLGAMLLSDVGVTAYKGSASLIASKTLLEAAAGILATEAYHTGLIRSLLYRRGIPGTTIPTAVNNRAYSEAISNARDTIDGTATTAGPPALFADDDQGVAPVTINGGTASNVVPTDSNGIVFGRNANQVLNIAYLNANSRTAGASAGGFFPSGLNGNIRTSAPTP